MSHHEKKADLVLFAPAVFDCVGDVPFSGGVAVCDNIITAVGAPDIIKDMIGPHTKVLSFDDGMIMPGFHDFHIHLKLGALSQETVNLHEAHSEDQAAEMVRAYADANPGDPWVLGYSWYHIFWDEKALPSKRSLDRLMPDRPVFLFNAEYHGAWVNSKALEICGITKDTPNPPFGEIARDETGEPTGFLYETAMGLAKQAFAFSRPRSEKILQNFLAKAASLGVTSVGDMLPLPGMDLGDLELYADFEKQARLTTRIFFQTALNGELDYPQRMRQLYTSDMLRFAGLKQFIDGVSTTYTALMVEPYADRPDYRGSSLWPEDILKQWITAADRNGFRVRLHSCGDGSLRLGLDCYEAAMKTNGHRDARHCIEHCEIVHPDDLHRFAELGVIASMQPEHITITDKWEDDPYPARLGPQRERMTWPYRQLQQAGTRFALGTDYPVVDLNPFPGIYRGLTRLHNDGLPEGGWNPDEKLTMAEILKYWTIGSAYGNFMEDKLGTLEVGKLADIIVVDRNLFTCSPDAVKQAGVLLTISDGRIVFEKTE